jgi:glycosyltransferase involved in cell wall biosynthesis
MPKVLRIINRFNLGGPTYNAAYLSKFMAPEFETLLYGGSIDKTEGDATFIVRDLGIEPLVIPEMHRSLNILNDYKAYKKIKKIISGFKPDIVHTHASKAGALGRLAAYKLGVPVILHTFHGHVFDKYFSNLSSSFYINTERYLAKKSTRIIALSENQKRELADKYKICPAEKIEIIPLGFDLDRFHENADTKRKEFRKKFNIRDDEIVVSIIGRLVPVKNHELFIQAIQEILKKTTKKIRVFIVGDGESKDKIIDLIRESGLSYTEKVTESHQNLVTFTSWIKDVDTVIAGTDIIAMTSLNEGTPVSLIEAQAGSRPVISTNVGGIENVVIPGVTALLSPNNDCKLFANNLLSVIESEELRAELSRNGWQNVKEKFHYMRLVNDTKNLYSRLLKQ